MYWCEGVVWGEWGGGEEGEEEEERGGGVGDAGVHLLKAVVTF